jgi:hypothetical protein
MLKSCEVLKSAVSPLGADLAAFICEALEIAMTTYFKSLSIENVCVHQSHIDRAFSKIFPSISEAVILIFFLNKFS